MIEFPRSIPPVAIAFAMTSVGVLADAILKVASVRESMTLLAVAALLYGLTAIGWYKVLASASLSSVGVWYSAMVILMLSAVGYIFFNEVLTVKQLAGVACALAAIFLMI